MSTRRGVERDRRGDYDDDRDRRGDRRKDREQESRPIRDEPTREKRPRPAPAGSLNEYFVDGQGIHREVLQKEICRFLGPEAISTPKTYKGVEGYMIKAVRPFTTKMLDDLIRLSENYISEREAMKMRGHRGLTYGDSATRQEARALQDVDMEDEDSLDDDDNKRGSRAHRAPRDRDFRDPRNNRDPRDTLFPLASSYAPVSSQPPYGSTPAYTSQPQGTGYPPSSYPSGAPIQGSQYPLVSGYSAPGYPATSRAGPSEPTYMYATGEYSNVSDPYGRVPAGYPIPGSRDLDRQEPRDRGYPTSGRVDTREPRDSRQPVPRYSEYPLSPPGGGDVAMGGTESDRYDYVTAASGQPGRNYSTTSRINPPLYDRHSPDLPGPYRHEPRGDERRRDRR